MEEKEFETLLDGETYLESLRDGREVFIDGEKVEDVTSHPAFRNSARSIARIYDSMHDPDLRDQLTAVDRFGIRTHKFFQPSYTAKELREARDALVIWARMSYGFMGRTPDYKAAFMASMGCAPEFYEPYTDNALNWYKKYALRGLFLNHVLINPPIDRKKPIHEVKDVFVHVEKETDNGIIVSGAKMLATGSALTHATFVAQNSAVHLDPENAKDFALVFIAEVDTPRSKLLCRRSYESSARSPFDNPLSSRFDENDAVIVFDKALIPWENVLVYRDTERATAFYGASGFFQRYNLQAATRLAVKLDFMSGLFAKAIESNGTENFRGVQVALGNILAWRHLIWGLTETMCRNPEQGPGGCVVPRVEDALAARIFGRESWPAIHNLFETFLGGSPLVAPSSYRDFHHPELRPLLDKYYRGSDSDAVERIKLMKLIWDSIGSEFGGRHLLYELNYSGNNEQIRIDVVTNAEKRGVLDECKSLVDRCMSDYDLSGWTGQDWVFDE